MDVGKPIASSFQAPKEVMVLSAARVRLVPPTEVAHGDDDGYTTEGASGSGTKGSNLQFDVPKSQRRQPVRARLRPSTG
jgi:hypothetical protein